MKNNLLVPSLIVLALLYACSSDKTQEKEIVDIEPIPQIELSEHLKMDSDEVRMFTMPTPLQIATTVKLMGVEYNDELLLPPYNNFYKSDIDMALGLGAYVVDMGYTTVYNNFQKSINYGQDIQVLMEKLNISHYISQGLVERFKNNADNQDSLCQIILSTYGEAHSYFTEDEGLGLLILTGAYIEGLYIATQNLNDSKWQEQNDNIYIQQKLFLDNFILLLSGYTENSKINNIVNELKALKIELNHIKIFSDPNKNGDYSLETPITIDNKESIKKEVKRVRNKLLRGN